MFFLNDVILSSGLHFNLSCTCINSFSEQSVLVPVCSCSSVMPELEIFLATRCTFTNFTSTYAHILVFHNLGSALSIDVDIYCEVVSQC